MTAPRTIWLSVAAFLAVTAQEVQLAFGAYSTFNAASNANVPQLPLLTLFPDGCGAVTQALAGDTCDSVAAAAGLTLAQLQALNPMVLCGIIALQPGQPLCTGGPTAFCSNQFQSRGGDTCKSISKRLGTVVSINGDSNYGCAALAASSGNQTVCVNPNVSQCHKKNICGVSLTADLQNMLAAQPDICSILSECQATTSQTTVQGAPSLSITITSKTPAVSAALGNPGHPALGQFATALAAGQPSSLLVTLTPNWFPADGSGITMYQFGVVSSTSGSGNGNDDDNSNDRTVKGRGLLASAWVPRYYGPTSSLKVPIPII